MAKQAPHMSPNDQEDWDNHYLEKTVAHGLEASLSVGHKAGVYTRVDDWVVKWYRYYMEYRQTPTQVSLVVLLSRSP